MPDTRVAATTQHFLVYRIKTGTAFVLLHHQAGRVWLHDLRSNYLPGRAQVVSQTNSPQPALRFLVCAGAKNSVARTLGISFPAPFFADVIFR